MNVTDYPVTTPYGQVPGYPLNNGFHTGIDYGCPVGTPVVVNGITIGLSGNTGASTGPHCHVGKYVGGQVQNPGVGSGFNFQSAIVQGIGQDSTNGKYVRVSGDGASWVYLHLSDNSLVTAGQVLQGDQDMATNEQIDQWISLFHQEAYGKPPTDQVFNDWRPVLKNNFVDGSLSIMIGTDTNSGALKNQPQGNPDAKPLGPGVYKVG